jgi:hypothetical protein
MNRIPFYTEKKQSKAIHKSFVFQLDLVNKIKDEADKRGLSQNELVSRILKGYFFGEAE